MISANEYHLINSLTKNIISSYDNVVLHKSKFENDVHIELCLVDVCDDVGGFEESLCFILDDLGKSLPYGFGFHHMFFYPDKLFKDICCNIVVWKCT